MILIIALSLKSIQDTQGLPALYAVKPLTFFLLFTLKNVVIAPPNEMIERKLVIPVMKPIEWEED